MKDYTTSTPAFSKSIKILETTDPGHADNVNVTTMQLLQNALSNRALINALIGWVYNEDSGAVISMLPQDFSSEKLTIREGMASISGEIMSLVVS